MIHRAVLGSLERFFALLIERTMGRWPVWLNPRQVMIIPKSTDDIEYARHAAQVISSADPADGNQPRLRPLHSEVVSVKVDDSTDQSISYRIKDAHSMKYNFKIVVGSREREAGNLAVDITGVPDHEDCIPASLERIGYKQIAEHARGSPKKVQMATEQLRHLILDLVKNYR
jgi:threonyl-tRNA synthetase